MTIRSYDINLDSFNATIPEPIIGRQGDKNGAVTLHVSITDRGMAVDLTGQTINLMAETAKGTAIVADNLGVTLTDAVNGKFDYAIPNALWSESGKITRAYFSLNDADGQQTTYDLIFIVKKAIDISQDKADDYITIIDGTLRDLKTKIDAIYAEYQNGRFYSRSEIDGLLGNYYTRDEIKTFFNDISIKSEWFGIAADGVTDDTDKIQAMFNGLSKPANVIFPQNSKIIVSKPIVITNSNLKINFNGSTLKYTGTQALDHNNGSDRYYGALMFVGTVETDYKNISSVVQNKGFVVPKNTLGHTDYDGQTTPPDQVSELKLASGVNNDFAIGDYVEVTIKNYDGTYSKTYADNPAEINGIECEVVAIDGQKVYVDFASDYVFDNLKSATIRKIIPVKNIEINDLKFEDNNETVIPDSPTSDDRDSWVSGLKFIRCANVRINNFSASKHRFPALSMWQVHGYDITDSEASDARYLGPGCGYLMQLISTTHGIVNNAHGINIRHLVDLSASGHVLIKNSRMPNAWLNAFDCHGTGEFDVSYQNCVGNFLFGNNIAELPNMTDKVSIINCKGSITASWIHQLTIIDSDVHIFDYNNNQRIVKFRVIGSKLTVQDNVTKVFASSRGSYNNSFFEISNSSIKYSTNSSYGSTISLRIEGYETVSLTGLSGIINNSNVFQTIEFLKCNIISLDNIPNITNVGFYIVNVSTAGDEYVSETTADNGVFSVRNVKFINSISSSLAASFVNIDNFGSASNYTLNYNQCMFTSTTESRWLRINTTFAAVVNATNNILTGAISAYLSAGTLPVVRSVDNIDKSSMETRLRIVSFKSNLALSTGDKGVTFRFPSYRKQYSTDYAVQVTPSFNSGAIWAHNKTTGQVAINWQTKAPSGAYLSISIN